MHKHEEIAAAMTGGRQENTGTMAMGSLLADMNHDIRTSMNGVRGMLELLLDTGLTPSQQEYARTAQHNVDTLLESLERIVDMSLIESNSFRFNQAPFDLLQEVQAALSGKQASGRSKGIEVSISLPPPVRLDGDAARLREAFSALGDVALQCAAGEFMSLAASASYLPGGRCRIVLEAQIPQSSEDSVNLVPLMDGVGPLQGVVGSKDLLGMTVCTRLVHMMQGTITVDRAHPPATVLRISIDLPLASASSAEMETALVPLCMGSNGSPSSAGSPDSRKSEEIAAAYSCCTVLVADDNPVNQQVAARMLEKLGCKTAVAADGMQAVEMHTWKCFDLILMDCEMPVLDGLEATQRIRAAEGPGRRTPIIALTASTGQGEQERCLAAGMDDFLPKPIRPQLLGDVLARWLARPSSTTVEAGTACEDELAEVKEMFGADFAEIASLYQSDGAPRLEAMREAAAAGDCTKVAKVAHAFGGSCASIGATGLAALSKTVETAAKAGSLEGFDQRMTGIENEYRRVCGKLQSLLTS